MMQLMQVYKCYINPVKLKSGEVTLAMANIHYTLEQMKDLRNN